jgi:plastocyanin
MRRLSRLLPLVLIVAALVPVGVIAASAAHRSGGTTYTVKIPDADRFAPFALTIHVGDSVRWINLDSDDHTVVSDDVFDTTGHQGTDHLIPADGGTFTLTFTQPGAFVYFCRFHSHLDGFSQPVAPGPEGGIQDQHGNFGTPMSGVITVIGD